MGKQRQTIANQRLHKAPPVWFRAVDFPGQDRQSSKRRCMPIMTLSSSGLRGILHMKAVFVLQAVSLIVDIVTP